MSQDGKPWGGRFAEATDAFVETFTASISFDRRLYGYDIQGSIAHANMLANVGILTADECTRIVAGLQAIHKEIDEGQFEWQVSLEDVHMNIESRLIDLIGDTGKKLHTGRSRNDQIATDIRLYLRAEIDELLTAEKILLNEILDLAETNAATIMPGFTHLQTAQPITFGHHLLAWFEMLLRDRQRLTDCRVRVNVLPLGSAALAGTTFPIDREQVATELEFAAVCENSLDAVSDRDFIIEFCAIASLTMGHFSRWSEELVLWMSQQFSFVDLPDRFCTGSSIMPQKKNPDVPELIRGKTSRVTGALMSLLMLMKSQPLAYNKDNQEDKEPLFDTVDTLRDSITAFTGLIPAIEANTENMRAAANAGFATATDLADYLVRRNVPFRDAHEAVGKAVSHAIEKGKRLDQLLLEELQQFSGEIEADVFDVLTLEGSVAARNHFGATAPEQVRAAVKRARARLS
ncbi:MAG: argininosuccinate lyase [Pseudomonadales bacterium]|jgi:argininosuccinate lyase